MSLTRLSITCSQPPVISEGVPEPTRLSDHVQKTEVSTGSTQWAASWHKPSGSLADFLSSNYIHNFWWQLHDFYFHSRVTERAYCYGSLWFGVQGLWNKRREQAVISQCKHRMHSTSIICVCIYDILPRVLVDCRRRFAAFITECDLGAVYSPGKGWPSISLSFNLTAPLSITPFYHLFIWQAVFLFVLVENLVRSQLGPQRSGREQSRLLWFGSTDGHLPRVGARIPGHYLCVKTREFANLFGWLHTGNAQKSALKG